MAAKTLAAALRQLSGKHHAHGCRECGNRYTDACNLVEQDGLCQICRGQKERPLWDRNGDPRECCVENSKLCTPEEVSVYKLGGTRGWYRCRKCSRTHPFDPRRTHEPAASSSSNAH